MSVGKYLAPVAGGIALALIGYDSHIAGKIRSGSYEKNHKAESLEHHLMADQKQESASTLKGEMKKELLKYHMDENFSGFFTGTIGYFKGVTSMLTRNVIPLTLAIGTFAGIGNKGIIRNTVAKASGIGLAAYGVITLAQEIFGIGKGH